MITTTNTTCDSIEIQSELQLFEEKITSTDEILITLEVFTNCSTTSIKTIDIVTTVIPGAPIEGSIHVENNGTNNFITLVPTNIVDGSSSFGADVLFLKLKSVNTSTNTTKTEQACILLSCDLKCTITNFLIENPECTEAGIIYRSLELSEECPECDCEDTCILYNKLQYLLNKETDVKCGCINNPEVLAIY